MNLIEISQSFKYLEQFYIDVHEYSQEPSFTNESQSRDHF